jgi:hypothetical protein
MFNNVDKLQFWYNNLPKDKEIACQIGPVKALPLVPITVVNPSVSIGGETITFPVSMKSGMYLEFRSQNDCKLYGMQGEFLQDIKIRGKIPVLKNGDNQISFLCKGTEGVSSRVQVTVISDGNPLRNNN